MASVSAAIAASSPPPEAGRGSGASRAPARRQGRDAPGERDGLRHQRVVGHHLADQPPVCACAASKRSPSMISSRARCSPTRRGSSSVTPPVTNTPSANLREEEARALGGDGEVAVDHPFEPAADGPAADRADHRRVAQHHRAGDVLDAFDIGPGRRLTAGLGAELLQIVARRRTRAPRRSARSRGRRDRDRRRQRRDQILQQFRHDRVEPMRPVQGDDAHTVARHPRSSTVPVMSDPF